MADIIPFDMVEDDVSGLASLPIGGGVIPFDQVEDDTIPASDASAIKSAMYKGVGNMLGLVGEITPTFEGGSVFAPNLFGLSGYLGARQPKLPTSEAGNLFKQRAKELGLISEAKPSSTLGELTSDVIEQGLSAGPFGPAAVISSAVTSGPGATVGRKLGGETGATIGSVISPFAIAGGKTLLREGAQKLGPTFAHLPGIPKSVSEAVTNRAVGQTLRSAVPDPDEIVKTLAASSPNPFQTAAEIADSGPLASIEDAVRARGAEALTGLPEARATAREGILGTVREVSPYELSKEVEGALTASADEVKKSEKLLWSALPGERPLPIGYKINEINKAIDDVTLAGSIPLPNSIKGLMKRLEGTEDGAMSIDQLQSLRSKALEVARDAGRDPSEAGRITQRLAGKIADELVSAVDDSASLGILGEDTASVWSAARNATRNKYEVFGETQATKAALAGDELRDITALREGLKSPDKLAAQLAAGDMEGVNLRPIYQDAIKSELSKLPQTKWPKYFEDNQHQLNLIFGDDVASFDKVLADIASEQRKNNLARSAFAGNSATFTRGSVDRFLDRNKGIAAIPAWVTGGATLGGAGYGAQQGWQAGDTFPEKVALGLLGGAAGLAGGKIAGGAITRASGAYDEALVNTLRNPKIAAARMQEAAPGTFGRAINQALKEAMPQAAGRGFSESGKGIQAYFTPSTDPEPDSQPREAQELFQTSSGEVNMARPELLKAVKLVESSNNPNAIGPETKYGRAKGAYQFLDSTGKEWHQRLGLPGEYDPFNEDQQELIADAYLSHLTDKYGGNETLATAAYNWGMGNLDKLIRSVGSTDINDLYDFLPKETQKYVLKVDRLANQVA